jgi:phosphatidylserine decarboxylase
MKSPDVGHVAVVMVGASGVGNIAVTHGFDSATVRTKNERTRVEVRDVEVARGDELGAFRLGSTVVVVFEPGRVELDLDRLGEVGDVVRFGARMATVATNGGRRA